MKGCVDWWSGLEPGRRKSMFTAFLGKASRSLTTEIAKEPSNDLKSEISFFDVKAERPLRYGPTASWRRANKPPLRDPLDFCSEVVPGPSSGKPHLLADLFKRLLVLQEISAMHLAFQVSELDKEMVFFSTLDSAHTVSDCVLRRLRGLLMVVSSDYINLELMGDAKLKIFQNSNKEKNNTGYRKGKNKCSNSKKLNSMPKPSKDHGCRGDIGKDTVPRLSPRESTLCVAANQKTRAVNTSLQKDLEDENSVPKHKMGNAVSLVDCKGPADKKKNGRKGAKVKTNSSKKLGNPELKNRNPTIQSVAADDVLANSGGLNDPVQPVINDTAIGADVPQLSSSCYGDDGREVVDDNKLRKSPRVLHSVSDSCELGVDSKDEEIQRTESSTPIVNTCHKLMGPRNASPTRYSTNLSSFEAMSPTLPNWEPRKTMTSSELARHTSRCTGERSTVPVAHPKSFQASITHSMGITSYEWPSIAPLSFSYASSQHFPAISDRLHLDVGHKCPSHYHQPFLPSRPQIRNSSLEGAQSLLPSPTLSFDWPLMVKSSSRLSQTVSVSYDSASERADDSENYWWSEEESDTNALSGRDYNQFFGGGVMYWNSGEHVGTGFSRPPSHSSEDSSWAWREADLNRAIDDMVGLPGMPNSYNSNGLASPPAATFYSPFDSLGPGHQAVGYAMSANDGNGKVLHSSPSVSDASEEKVSRPVNSSSSGVEGVKGDQLPYPRLRPIIVPSMSRKGSRSDFKLGHDHKSSCVPSARMDPPRIKRPPSPVVLCVPPVPRPPPPSPVGVSRKRGFPSVRSGSSSPRHWGMRSWYHEESNSEETRLCLDGAEVVWPSWGDKDLSATPVVQSIQGSFLQDHLFNISQLARDQGHPDVALPLQPPELPDCSSHKASLSMMHSLLHEEIETFCKQVCAKNLIKKPYINWAVKRVTRSLQVLWPRSRTNIFGSNATGLALPTSDVDLVVSLPPVRNLEPIKEAGILEGRNGIKETCLQHAARYLANQEWVRNDSLKTIENTAIPVIMLLVEVPHDIGFKTANSPSVDAPQSQSTKMPGEQVGVSYSELMYSDIRKDGTFDLNSLEAKSIHLDISFKSPSHTGLQTSELVRQLTQQFPASVPLALVLKKFLADRSLDHSYSGGLSSYCLMLLITRFLQHGHHIGRPINQNLGSLLMDFLYFFGNVFDPRQMRVSIQGSGVYMNRERGLSIDPIHIDDPLYPSNNVGRNCFRIHQCIKAFADAYSVLKNELNQFSGDDGTTTSTFQLLSKIIPSIDREE